MFFHNSFIELNSKRGRGQYFRRVDTQQIKMVFIESDYTVRGSVMRYAYWLVGSSKGLNPFSVEVV